MTGINPNAALISSLQSRLRTDFANAVPDPRRRYAVLDFPNYCNVGDSAIYLGQDILLSEYFARPPHIITEAHDSDIAKIERHAHEIDVLLLNGGGNFGDLWPHHQRFRERVIARFPDKTIVQLPQTLYFNDPANLDRAASVINQHPDFTLMVRDHVSERIARHAFNCPVLVTPDMAFMLGATASTHAADLPMLGLMREDQEARFQGPDVLGKLLPASEILDWPREPDERQGRLVRLRNRYLRSGRTAPDYYRRLARQRLQTGLALLSRGDIVVTDRLHAHILCLLLGKRHVVLDNSYGKLSTFIDAWTTGGDFAIASTVADAARLADGMAGRSATYTRARALA